MEYESPALENGPSGSHFQSYRPKGLLDLNPFSEITFLCFSTTLIRAISRQLAEILGFYFARVP